jgi:hypothetical protein
VAGARPTTATLTGAGGAVFMITSANMTVSVMSIPPRTANASSDFISWSPIPNNYDPSGLCCSGTGWRVNGRGFYFSLRLGDALVTTPQNISSFLKPKLLRKIPAAVQSRFSALVR